METVTLRGQDFKTVHNTLCELRAVQQQLTGVINDRLADQLHRVVKGFEAGLADAYQQDNAAFDAKHDHYNEVREQLGLTTIWSIYNVQNLNERHPFEGATEVLYKDHWGQRAISKPIVGSTWAALYVAANACIRDSGDDHHIFIEQFVADQPQPGVLRLTTGS